MTNDHLGGMGCFICEISDTPQGEVSLEDCSSDSASTSHLETVISQQVNIIHEGSSHRQVSVSLIKGTQQFRH